MPHSQPSRRRFAPGLWYQRVPCDPPPIDLARRLAEAKVASKAAKRIDTYERFHHQHLEHRRQVVRGVLGAAGLVLSVVPSVPTLVASCGHQRDLECGLRVTAMLGGALALTVTGWAFWDLYHQPSRLSDHVAKLNAEMARSMQARNGDVAVERLFDLYRGMTRDEQVELKSYLHERAADPAGAPLALSGLPTAASRAGETVVDLEGYGGDDDEAESLEGRDGPRWEDASECPGPDEAPSLPEALPPASLLAPASPRPWHGVTLRRIQGA